LRARDEHPAWGARKLKRYLENQGHVTVPSKSAIGDILKRNERIEPEESAVHKPWRRFEREQPNELWQLDFKGDFVMLNGERCYPLTVLDDCSRYSLAVQALRNQQAGNVFAAFEDIFGEYGLPDSILCDNGNPWGDSRYGYTAFEKWMMQLNILPMHGRPLHPQTQGKEERFHRTMKRELLRLHPIEDWNDAQASFDRWRHEYNHERPHEAIGMEVPASVYKPSKRPLQGALREPEYERGTRLRKINCKGYLSIHDQRYYLSETFAGAYLELNETAQDIFSVCYGGFQIAKIDCAEKLVISKKIIRIER
jgi:transposase InsO family protein